MTAQEFCNEIENFFFDQEVQLMPADPDTLMATCAGVLITLFSDGWWRYEYNGFSGEGSSLGKAHGSFHRKI